MSEFKDLAELKTIKDFIRWGSSEMQRNNVYFGHGFSSALDESVYCCLFALKLPNDWPTFYFDSQLIEAEKRAIYELISLRIKSRLPLSYLTNEAWFCGLKFYVDERVLVPRSPIAELIQNQFSPWVDPMSVSSVLDLCTGSGCIAIACQYAFPEAQVSASDLSKDALEVATKNREEHGLVDDIVLIESDCFDAIPPQTFDLIVSNPPYVDARDIAEMPSEYQQEPILGLESGDDGLDLTYRILTQAGDYLSEHGVLIVEVGNSAHALMEQLVDVPLSWIEFEHGGEGVFYISAADLQNSQTTINSIFQQRLA